MPRTRPPLPPVLPPNFAVRVASSVGVSKHRLQAPDLARPFHGARELTAPEPVPDIDNWWEERSRNFDHLVMAYLPVMPSHSFLCGATAAHLWDIPLPRRIDATLEVGVWRPRTAPVRPGITGRQFTIGFVGVVEVDGIRLTDPASTWATLGRMLYDEELVAAADRVLHVPRHPGGFRPVTETALATREEWEKRVERKGRPGAPALRRALERARDGAASPPETQIRLILQDAGFPAPELDFDVYDKRGRFLGCSELAYPERKIAIEYESDGHLTRPQLERDIDKYQAYAEAGWTVVRLTSAHVYTDPRETVRRVRAARAAAASRR